MEYRRLGKAGLKVSVLSFGSWVTFGKQVDTTLAESCLGYAYDHGVNFFDNAEVYSGGMSETIMGEAIRKLKWARHSYVLSSKFYFGIEEGVNTRMTLNRKYLMQAVEGSLKRLQQDFLDLIFCHRPDPDTPIEEVVFAMHDIISSGKALYWGTSEWSAADIRAAWEIAERHHLHKPVMEQPQYNILERQKVEHEYARLYDDIGLGLTTWSPLASGVLTGKYVNGIPEGSRATLSGYEWLRRGLTNPEVNAKVKDLLVVADDLGCTLAELSIAWCTLNPHVSTVITGASRLDQLKSNLNALDVVSKITPDVQDRIDAIILGEHVALHA
ncbi:MAG: potassium channel beta subunit family protein [Candidatus Dormibacteria bacterium]